MGPIMGVGLGIGIQAPGIIRNAVSNLLVAVGISILTSALYFTISPIEEASKELLQGRLLRCSTLAWHCLADLLGFWLVREKKNPTWCRVWP